MKPKEWWRDNSETWLKKMRYWEQQSKGNSRHFRDERDFLINKITNDLDFGKILEVGAGNGRIIGRITEDSL